METKSNNLNTFRILYLIKGILTFCFSLFFFIYACIGFFVNRAIEHSEQPQELPFNFGWLFVIIGGVGIIACIVLGILNLLASKYIKETKYYNFIYAIAVINCLTGILGILLGVFTLIELTKEDVKGLFNK
ncbi:hypothetical protein SAMN05421824_2361 [Hyunsoonleella jejuensis]|uniref:Tetraspanin family protein n=1 Tax=Hyunsoonleella jejuensis TaxID=419940 RepID=A0A1H9J1F4_9FLAO|nr:hypothetical protein [Hyunsoonleella jejuensis]SEQ80618.1 hypothetical protein SAMN05421824_2361 [Hyunsoonleella jejuensis]